MSLRSDTSSTDTMFADVAHAPFVGDLLFSRQKSHDGTRSALYHAVINLRKKFCVTPHNKRSVK